MRVYWKNSYDFPLIKTLFGSVQFGYVTFGRPPGVPLFVPFVLLHPQHMPILILTKLLPFVKVLFASEF